MPKIGAHVSAAVSLETAFKKAQEIGAECIQIFISPPQQWLKTPHKPEEIELFRKTQKESGIGPNFIHGTYLINLGTKDGVHLHRSIDWLIWSLKTAKNMDIEGVIFHLGSHKGAGFEAVKYQIIDALKKILSSTAPSENGKPYLLLETSAGAGGNIGASFHELGIILKEVNNSRLKVCLDTQHTFAAGYDIKSPLGLKDVLEEFDKEIGLAQLAAVHINDSKTEYKSGKDRHENIGEGFIGIEGFENIINHPKLNHLPLILEVPGFSGNGPDQDNITRLKSLIRR